MKNNYYLRILSKYIAGTSIDIFNSYISYVSFYIGCYENFIIAQFFTLYCVLVWPFYYYIFESSFLEKFLNNTYII